MSKNRVLVAGENDAMDRGLDLKHLKGPGRKKGVIKGMVVEIRFIYS